MPGRLRMGPSGRRSCGAGQAWAAWSEARDLGRARGTPQGAVHGAFGASWQRCRVHFMRNLLATIPHSAREPVAAIVRTIFAQPDRATAMTQLHKVVDGLRRDQGIDLVIDGTIPAQCKAYDGRLLPLGL